MRENLLFLFFLILFLPFYSELRQEREKGLKKIKRKERRTKMFGVPSDQFHQFADAAAAAASTASELRPPPPFPLHVSSSTFPSFDLIPSSSVGGGGGAAAAPQAFQVAHLLHHPLHPHKDDQDNQESAPVSIDLEPQKERSMIDLIDPWSNDEALALLRIRSSMENWFPDCTWEHVSRKLAEQGFKRSAEKCKEKLEKEIRFFNTSSNYGKNLRFVSELEELCNGESSPQQDVNEKNLNVVEKLKDEDKSLEEGDSRNETVAGNPCLGTEKVEGRSKGKKRKRHGQRGSLEMFAEFCESVVNKMMAQQEEMYKKLLEDMMKRNEEKIAREEAWKKREMDRMNKEFEIRVHEQAIADDRRATIIGFLKKFTSTSTPVQTLCFGINEGKVADTPNPLTSRSSILPQNPNPTISHLSPQIEQLQVATSSKNPSSSATPTSSNAPVHESQPPRNPTNAPSTQKSPSTTVDKDEELGKRWPRDEVLALINLRSSLNGEDKEISAKGPLWEWVSRRMLALGYMRSAKRCKEKWENINKYFRKTKEVSKKRSLDSRTCPYFHQLNALYSQGTLVVPPASKTDHLNPSENHSALLKNSSGVSI